MITCGLHQCLECENDVTDPANDDICEDCIMDQKEEVISYDEETFTCGVSRRGDDD